MNKILSTLALTLISIFLSANPVSLQQAKQTAVSFYSQNAASVITDLSVTHEKAFIYEGLTTYYVFGFNAGGWVIIAADDASIPVLGYSYDSQFDFSNIPAPLQGWLDEFGSNIKHLSDIKASNESSISEWKNISEGKINKGSKAVSPFVKTSWDQLCYYNSKCPTDISGDCGHATVGCVATAFGQVLKYYNYPPHGTGSRTDSLSNYGYLTVNFGTSTYNWKSMPNMLFTEDDDVATLLYHCGISVDMMYSPHGSGSGAEMIPDALVSYFDYSDKVGIQYIYDFSDADWKAMLKAELDAGRPVIYSGADKTVGGHCTVMDGYDASGKFHYNLGWGGMLNGYFAIGALNTGNGNFNYNNSALTNIVPNYSMSVSDHNAAAISNISIYPNPTKGNCTITIAIGKEEKASLSLYNLVGEKLSTALDGRLFSGTQQIELKLSDLPEGIYFLKLSLGSTTQTRKLIITK